MTISYIEKILSKNKTVLPVIHHLDSNTTLKQASIAYECGADGVFLISHFNKDDELGPLAKILKEKNWKVGCENFTIGLNLLSTNAINSFDIANNFRVDHLWLDNAGVSSKGLNDLAQQLLLKMKSHRNLEVFSSVAFKYQEEDLNPPQAGLIAKKNGFIPTTSGTKTGSPPTVEKIKSMSEATDGLLAVASGMTVHNIENYVPYLSHILVSTGVSLDDYRFDSELLCKFIGKVKNI